MRNRPVLICILAAIFFQGWPVVHGFYDGRNTVLISTNIQELPESALHKDLFPKTSGTYKLEFFSTEKDETKRAATPHFLWVFGSQGKVLNQGQGASEFTMNAGQIYYVDISSKELKEQVPPEQQDKSFIRLGLDQGEMLNKATNRYIFGTILSFIFAGLAFFFYRRSRHNAQRA